MIDTTDFAHFAHLLKARSGIELDAQKEYLIRSRLASVAAQEGLETVDDLLRVLRLRPTETVIARAVDAMTTNETFFFRDENPFEHIRRIMTEAARAGRPRLRIWSAACSTGQEPYSLLMLWDEVAHLAPNLRLEIVATDLSAACLTKARSGLYTGFEVQRGLSAQKLVTYFDKVDDNWRVKPHLRGAVAWSQHNLLESPHALGKFDIVLCRNVLIYFERETRSRVLELIARQLLPGGHLLLGASETILGLTTAVRNAPAGPGLYVKPDLEPESSTSSLAG